MWVGHSTVFHDLRATNDSYRVDETDIKIKKRWYCLYRAVDSTGAVDREKALVQVLLVPRPGPAATQLIGIVLATRAASLADGLIGDDHATDK